jgi:hypothetical protein
VLKVVNITASVGFVAFYACHIIFIHLELLYSIVYYDVKLNLNVINIPICGLLALKLPCY